VKNWGRRLREWLGEPGEAPVEGELGRLLQELKQHEADASATQNQMGSPLPCGVPTTSGKSLHHCTTTGPLGPPRGYRTNALGGLAPNDLEASSRIGGAAQGLGDVVGLCVVTRSGQRRSTGATQSCAPTLPPPMAGLAAMTGMHRSDGLTRGKFAPNFDSPCASTPRRRACNFCEEVPQTGIASGVEILTSIVRHAALVQSPSELALCIPS
jgi:hypothetical protein